MSILFQRDNSTILSSSDAIPDEEISPREKIITDLLIEALRQQAAPEEAELEGYAIKVFPDGRTYEGEFVCGIPHGRGLMTFPDGRFYAGAFQDGRMELGHMTYPDGNTYACSDGELEGYGKITFSDGRVYEGDFLNGEPHGCGLMTYPDGYFYSGEFFHGHVHGEGRAVYLSGQEYKGRFIDGSLEGEGVICFSNGESCEVEFSHGTPLGNHTNLGDFRFLHLLIGTDDISATSGYALGILADYLKHDALASAKQKLLVDLDECEKIHEQINHAPQLFTLRANSVHMMGMNITPDGDDFTFDIFNSGQGLSQFHQKHPTKPNTFKTALRVRVPKTSVTPDLIKKILVGFETTAEAYNTILQLPGAEKIDWETAVWQTSQKGDNCTLEWIFAYLKNTMPLFEYTEMRMKLFDDAITAAKEKEGREDLISKLEAKKDKREVALLQLRLERL